MAGALKVESLSPSRPLINSKPIERYVDDAQCLIWFGNVQIILSRTPPTRELMRRIVREIEDLAKRYSSGVGALLVIRSDATPPDEEARAYIRKELGQAPMIAAAQVVTGTGFQGAAMRSVLSLMQLLSRPPYPMKVFGDVAPASAWLTHELEVRARQAPLDRELTLAASAAHARFLADGLPARVRS